MKLTAAQARASAKVNKPIVLAKELTDIMLAIRWAAQKGKFEVWSEVALQKETLDTLQSLGYLLAPNSHHTHISWK